MTKITFDEISLTPEQMEKERVKFNNLLREDLTLVVDSFAGSFSLVSDEHLHVKPILRDENIKTALELCRIAKESHCNTKHDNIIVARYQSE